MPRRGFAGWAPALIAAAMLAGAAPCLADTPEAQDPRLLRVRVADGEIDPAMDALIMDRVLYLPAVRLADLLARPYRLSEDGRTLMVDLPGPAGQTTIDLTPAGSATITSGGEVFIPQDRAEALFSIVLEADLEHDLLVVRSADGAPLPVEERLQREATWRQFGASGPGVDPVPVTPTPWTMYAPVMGDITLTGRSASDGSSSLDYNGLVVGELAWLTHEFYVSGQVGGGPGDLRLTSGRRDYNGGVFGVPTLYEAVVGDVLGHTIPLVGRPAMGRGFSLGGRPLAQPTEFDATRVEGDALPGWAAELYRNNELISVQIIGASGRYRFDDVALNFGRNQLLVRLYGPQGQMREVVQTIGVGADMAPPGSFRWATFLDQPDQRLFDALLDRQPRHDAVAGGVSFDVGLTRNLSAGASVARAPISSRAGSAFASYGGVVLYAGVGPVAFETAATASDAAGWAWRLAALTSIGPASLSVRHEEYEDGYRSLDSELGFNALRRFSRARLSAPLSWLAPGLGSVSLTSDRFEHATGRREWAARGNWRVDLFGAHFDHGVEYRDIRQVDGTTFDEAFYVGAAALTRGPLSGRAQMRYRLTGDQGLQTYDVSVQYRLSETLILSAGVFRDEFSRRTGGSLGVSRDLGFAYLNLDGSWDDDGRYAIGAGLTFSFGFDSGGGARLASQPQARMGAIEPFVFLDRAGDGRYQAGEDEPLADVQLLVNGYPAPNAMTTRDGRAWLAGLSVGEPIRLAVDTASLPDAFLAPSQAEIAVQPRPGRAFRLEIPVVETGEISGVVEVVDAARREPLRGLRLELVNEQGEVRGTAVSMIDGAWLFGQVPPGRWIVRAAPSQTVRGAPVSPAFVHTAVRPDHLIVEGLGFQLDIHSGLTGYSSMIVEPSTHDGGRFSP